MSGIAELMRRLDAYADAHPVGDWIALGIVLFGLVCLSVSDWSRNRPRTPRS